MATTTTSYRVSEEPLESARADAIATLSDTRRHDADEARFDWLYRRNPDGEAVLWSIRDEQTGDMAGFTVALPRRMLVDGQLHSSWNGADFSIRPRYRTLGLALKLRREAKLAVDAGRVDFLYAHPNERMALIHAKVGHAPVGRMRRYARLLQSAGYLESRLRTERGARLAALAVDPVLRLIGRENRHRLHGSVRLLSPARFDSRFDELFAEAAPDRGVIGVRDAAYLNWRYADNPLYQTHALIAEQGDRLRGYVLFVVDEDTAAVKDVFPNGDAATARDLAASLIKSARQMRLRSVSAALLDGHPWIPILAEFGFRERPESGQMFAYTPDDRTWTAAVRDAGCWSVTVGDRDV